MKEFALSPLAPYPRFTRTARALIGACAAAGAAFVLATAGPGNGWQLPREVPVVQLPTVVIVGQRALPAQPRAASVAITSELAAESRLP